jgi:hypothetical protein
MAVRRSVAAILSNRGAARCAVGHLVGPGFCTTLSVVKPGKPPEIRKGQDSITVVMDVAPETSRSPIRLVVRCERDGQIYASIERGPDHTKE